MTPFCNAKEFAKRTSELNSRKQLILATMAYTGDYDDVLPYRGSGDLIYFPHLLHYTPGPDLNLIFVRPYLGKSDEVRETVMFCRSNLYEKRNSSYFQYYNDPSANAVNYGTLTYFRQPFHNANGTTGTGWKMDPFDVSSLRTGEPDLPVWACICLVKKNSGDWWGHNAPCAPVLPQGTIAAHMDGSAQWYNNKSMAFFYYDSSNNIWWFAPITPSMTGADRIFPAY